jgi:hypothetical protein
VNVDEEPRPSHGFSSLAGRIAGSIPLEPPPAEPWFIGDFWIARISGDAQARIDRWKARWDAKAAGRPVLSLTELGSLIKQTQTAIQSTSSAADRAVLGIQLEDMKHEYDWRTFLDVTETIWPA